MTYSKEHLGSRYSCRAAIWGLAIALSAFAAVSAEENRGLPFGECTVGVFGGSVTADGRPILWKNRDVTNPDQRFIYYNSYERDGIVTIPFIGDVYRSDTTRVYMGANLEGFAIMNSDSYNLDDSLSTGIDDGTIMRIALETCSSIADFGLLLDSTDAIGRKDCWNFGVMDASGTCAMFECRNYSYVLILPEGNDSPDNGMALRANFSRTGNDRQAGLDRYRRAVYLTENRMRRAPVDIEFVLQKLVRDLGNPYDDPYPLPYNRSQADGPIGYIFDYGCTISNRWTTSAVVIKGVAPGEDPVLTTIFAVLGSPVISMAYPLWVASGSVPVYLSRGQGAPMYEYCVDRKARLYDNPDAFFHLNSKALCDDDGTGIYTYSFLLERWGINNAERLLSSWRADSPETQDVSSEQLRIARALFTGYQRETAEYLTEAEPDIDIFPRTIGLSNYPNPFNASTVITYNGTWQGSDPIVRIYDSMGRLVNLLSAGGVSGGSIIWDGHDLFGKRVSSGVYFYTLDAGSFSTSNKMTLIK